MDSDGSLEVWVADGMTPRRRPIVWHVQLSWSAGRTACGPGVGLLCRLYSVTHTVHTVQPDFARLVTRRALVANGQLGLRWSSLILESPDSP